MNRILIILFTSLLLPVTAATASAEIISIEGTVKSVDLKKRTVTVEVEEKSRTLDVGSKAKISVDGKDGSLEMLKEGQSVSIGYHDQLEVVVKIDVNSADASTLLLFDGKTLNGWKTSGNGPIIGWEVVNGEIVLLGKKNAPLLISESKFDDFELQFDFFLENKANTGVFLRGRYEVQLLDNGGYPKLRPNQLCGAIYGQLSPSKAAYRGPEEWNSLLVRLEGRRVTVVLNGTMIIDDRELEGVTNGALDELEGEPGPIVFQSHTGSARFRNISIRRTSEDAHKSWLIGSFDINWTEKPGGNTGSLVYRFSPKQEVFRGDKLMGKWEQEGEQFRVEFADSDRGYVLITPEGDGELRATHFWLDGRQATWTGKRQKHKR